jgi:rhodanese-related sulfurtransferase
VNSLPQPQALTFEEVQARLEHPDFTLVDVMPEAGHLAGRLPGALNLSLEHLPGTAARLLPDRTVEIGVYCAGPD